MHPQQPLVLTACPQCGQLAEINDRFVLPSTDGTIEHAAVRCVNRHSFRLPIAALDVPDPYNNRSQARALD